MSAIHSKKLAEAIKVIEDTENWQKYATKGGLKVVTDFLRTRDITKTSDNLNMTYTNTRSHIFKTAERVSKKKTSYSRGGRGERSIELINLIEETPDWEKFVTGIEATVAKEFKEIKNFRSVGKKLGMAHSNVVGILYGTKQRHGVLEKIKAGKHKKMLTPKNDKKKEG